MATKKKTKKPSITNIILLASAVVILICYFLPVFHYTSVTEIGTTTNQNADEKFTLIDLIKGNNVNDDNYEDTEEHIQKAYSIFFQNETVKEARNYVTVAIICAILIILCIAYLVVALIVDKKLPMIFVSGPLCAITLVQFIFALLCTSKFSSVTVLLGTTTTTTALCFAPIVAVALGLICDCLPLAKLEKTK